MSSSIVHEAALIASIAAMSLSLFCALLAWRQQRCLAAMQTQLDSVSRAVDQLEGAHSSLLIRLMNSPNSRSRKAPKSSSLPSGRPQETSLSALKPRNEENSNGSALEVVAPKTSAE